jgi:hypothetical protein
MRQLLFVLCLIPLLAGCPATDDSAAGETSSASFNPSEPIPAEGPLLNYDKLRLGMDSLALSQVYNAPQGKGDGFNRVIQQYGDVAHHIINFDLEEGQPLRRIVATFYRDRLYIIVDRREGINKAQRDEWFDGVVAEYGDEYEAPLPNSQWVWGAGESVSLTFTQDNASADFMTANVVLEHTPTRDAAHDYLELWEQEHPGEVPAVN